MDGRAWKSVMCAERKLRCFGKYFVRRSVRIFCVALSRRRVRMRGWDGISDSWRCDGGG